MRSDMTDPSKLRNVPRTTIESVRRVNLPVGWHQDLYHNALSLRWWWFMALGCLAYLAVNVVFAILFLLQPDSIIGARPGSFVDAFFFSVQTIATIGYGQMSPATFYCNILVLLETMTGLVFLALATGITFARISRPTARVMYASAAVVGPRNRVPTLSFRIANARSSQILEADVRVSLLRYETSVEGERMRRFHDLQLVRSHTPVFALTFTIMHLIDETSPLFGVKPEDLEAGEAELLVTVTGLEEISSQTVHARHNYPAQEVRFGHRYVDIFLRDDTGERYIDYGRFHETEPAVP